MEQECEKLVENYTEMFVLEPDLNTEQARALVKVSNVPGKVIRKAIIFTNDKVSDTTAELVLIKKRKYFENRNQVLLKKLEAQQLNTRTNQVITKEIEQQYLDWKNELAMQWKETEQ